MALGDTLQRISPNDQFILDAAGNLSGVKTPHASGLDLLTDFIGTYTWATLPAAALVPNRRALASDVGIAPGMLVVSDGVRWMPCGVQVLARGSVSLPCPTDTTEDTLVTVAVPANLLGVNGRLEIVTHTFNTNSANTKTLRVRWSGGAGTAALTYSATTGSNMTTRTLIANRGAANTQFTQGDILGGAASVAITSVDTTAATSVVITGQKALGSETLQLDDYSVLVYP